MRKILTWTFVKFILPYLLILLTVVTLGNTIYEKMETSLVQETVEVQSAMLDSSRHVADDILLSVKKIGMEYSLNQQLINQLLEFEKNGRPDIASFGLVSKNLTQNWVVGEKGLQYVLYFRDADLLLTTYSMSTSPNNYYDLYLKYNGLSYQEWGDLLYSFNGFGHFVPAAELQATRSTQRVISYIRSVPFNLEDAIAVLQIMIPEETLQAAFTTYAVDKQGSCLIVNRKGELISYWGDTTQKPRTEEILNLDLDKPYTYLAPERGEKWGDYLFYLPSNETDWIYATILPEEEVLAQVYEIKDYTAIITAVLLVLVLVMSVGFALHHSVPMDRLVRKVHGLQTEGETGQGGRKPFSNSYAVIDHQLDALIQRNDDLISSYQEHMPYVVKNIVRGFILGRFVNSEEAVETLEDMGISIRREHYCVGIVRITKVDSEELQRLMPQAITESFGSQQVLIVNYTIDQMAVLYLGDSSTEAFRRQITEISQQAARNARKRGIECFCVVGTLVDALEDVHTSTKAAVKAASSILFNGRDLVYFVDEVEQSEIGSSPEPDEQKIINMVRQGALEELTRYLDRTRKGRSEADDDINVRPSESGRGCPNKELVMAMEAYIRTHYRDAGLRLSTIADHFHISEAYCGQIFKAGIGETFSTYLENIRMGHARSLLMHSDLSVESIAYEVGYSSINTFHKAFKRVNGVTPGNYKRYDKE